MVRTMPRPPLIPAASGYGLALLAIALLLAACQTGTAPVQAERALPPAEPAAVAAVAADPDACWAQARLTLPGGATEDRLFAVPCPAALTPEFWASVQRALGVRGLYAGPITGVPDAATAEAVRRWQAPLGLDSPVLSLDGARHLGLAIWPRDRL